MVLHGCWRLRLLANRSLAFVDGIYPHRLYDSPQGQVIIQLLLLSAQNGQEADMTRTVGPMSLKNDIGHVTLTLEWPSTRIPKMNGLFLFFLPHTYAKLPTSDSTFSLELTYKRRDQNKS